MKMYSRLALAVAALHAGEGHAIGLGELQLQSALNQPLQAVIHLQDSEGLAPPDIRVSLADADAFARTGIDRPFFLTDLRFTPVRAGQELVIRVESNRPIREPYLNFLVQIDRGNGALLREYTLLLDPPLYAPEPVIASVPDAVSVSSSRAGEGPLATPRQAGARPAPARALSSLQPQPGADRYQTRAGDSLWQVARATRLAPSVGIDEQMDAILALNADAFINGDPGLLRAGQELVLPTAQQVGLPSPAEPQPRSEPASGHGAVAVSAAELAGRVSIEEPKVHALTAEAEAMQQRLDILENRFQGLLGELEARDVQIASLQAELEIMRQARDTTEASVPEETGPQGSPVAVGVADKPFAPGAIESMADMAPEATEKTLVSRGWPLVLALLLMLAGGSWLRSRREAEEEHEQEFILRPVAPVPKPVAVPGSRTVDPLAGVELYLTYGRYAEARLMLDKAIAAEPGRIDLRMRMLDVLAELGDVGQFLEHEREALVRGADRRQIDQLKARHPRLLEGAWRETVEQLDEPLPLMPAGSGMLDLDDFELDPSWDLFDDLPGRGSRRREELYLLQENFESNLQDFPEVGELDDNVVSQFQERRDRSNG